MQYNNTRCNNWWSGIELYPSLQREICFNNICLFWFRKLLRIFKLHLLPRFAQTNSFLIFKFFQNQHVCEKHNQVIMLMNVKKQFVTESCPRIQKFALEEVSVSWKMVAFVSTVSLAPVARISCAMAVLEIVAALVVFAEVIKSFSLFSFIWKRQNV